MLLSHNIQRQMVIQAEQMWFTTSQECQDGKASLILPKKWQSILKEVSSSAMHDIYAMVPCENVM